MTDVRLDRTQQQRPDLRPPLPVRRQQRLRLDRVTQLGAGPVRLDHVHLVWGQTGVGQGLVDDPLLRRTVRSRQTVRRAVLVHRAAPHDGEHVVPVAPRVRQPLHQQHPDAFAPSRTVRRLREGLAPAVRCQAALPGELDERTGGRHDRDPAGKRQ